MDRKEVIANYTTWCSSKMLAGVKLANILNDIGESSLINTINTILYRYDRRLKELSRLTDSVNVHKQYFANLVMVDMKNDVIKHKFPINVETHLLNVMSAKYRQMLKIGKHIE